MRHAAIAALDLLSAAGSAAGEDDEDLLATIPPPVKAVSWCAEEGPGFATRRRFAGFIVFTVECPSNNQNYVRALIVADDANGGGARLLTFPTPHPGAVESDALSNIGWREGGEVSELFIDPEQIAGPCRHEARWRLSGPRPDAVLVFWRETHDWAGEGGWTVPVGE